MLISFLLGMVFGAFVMFMARIADVNVNKVVERYKDTGSVVRPKPIIVPPPKDDMEKLSEDLQKQLAKDYGRV